MNADDRPASAVGSKALRMILAIGLLNASANAPAAPGTELQVVRVVPEGRQVPAGGRQLVVTFDRPVVALGDMTSSLAQSAVEVEPATTCQWHWLDARSLACELDEVRALRGATAYTVTVRQGLRALDGATLTNFYRWTFATQRPVAKSYSFATWRSPGTPVVRVVFDQPVTEESVGKSMRFSSGVSAVAKPDPDAPGARAWFISPERELPADTRSRLSIVPGIRSAAGPLPGIERRAIVEFDTFPQFRFLGVRCTTGKTSILIPPTSVSAETACNPLGVVSLAFSAPVIAGEIKEHLSLRPDLLGGRTDYDPWANIYPRTQLSMPHRRGQEYSVDLPEHLRAFEDYSIAGLRRVRDEFGRELQGPDAMTFRTDHRPPRLKLSHPVAVLEKNVPTALPIYVTNLTDVDIHYRKLTSAGLTGNLSSNQAIDRAWDIAYATPAKVRDLLGGESGVVIGSLVPHPAPIGEGNDADEGPDTEEPGVPRGRRDRDFFVEVTPFQVHVKLGHYNTLVWVTSLASGAPIADARVRIYSDSYHDLTASASVLAESVTDRDGIAMLAGQAALDRSGKQAKRTHADVLMVRVDAGADLAVLPLDDAFEVDTYRASRGKFWSSYATNQTHVHAWGTTAQGVYKLGDTVQYKLYLRNQNNLTLEPMAVRDGYKLEIIDPTGKTVKTEASFSLSEFGAYAASFRVPPSGAVGWYEFRVTAPGKTASDVWTPMRVLIADFTPAPFQVQATLNGQMFEPGDHVEASTRATLHAGGPYANAAARTTARLFPQPLEISNPAAAGFEFAGAAPGGQCSSRRDPETLTVHQSDGNVDDKGELATRFDVPDADMISGRLEVETAVRDERGKYVASRASAQFRGRDRFVGLHANSWTLEEGKPTSVQYLVVDKTGRIVSGAPVAVSIDVQTVTAARVKGAGDAYLTDYQPHWSSLTSCNGSSAARPQSCGFTPSRPGLYSITAHVNDSHGRAHATEMCIWATGKGQLVWQEPEDMSLSLVPERESYRVGEKARYLVRNPFPGARALVTIERFGVIKKWVQPLNGNTPVIQFKIEPDFVPGFYLSVVVISPRVAPVHLDKEGVDLGRPTYRVGYVKVPVEDPYKTLDVHVASDRATYKPRESVRLELTAAAHNPGAAGAPIEFAVAVLDEAVFDLIQDGKGYFDPYRGLYEFDNLDLINYTLLSRLVGLQKFEKKGANSGGDGGSGFDMRNVSQYVAYWNPSVTADSRGRASVSFTLPDNLTAWRAFAIAVTPADRVGLGEVKFTSSQLTELRPVMPNQATAGDEFTAGFSVLNRSDKARTLNVDLSAQGPIVGGAAKAHQILVLPPFKRETVWLPVKTTGDGNVKFTAAAADSLDRDGLSQSIEVRKRISLDVAASYGTTDAGRVEENLHYPKDIMPDVGELSVTLSPTVLGNVDGALRYVKDYPYLCWEQRLSKALFALSYLQLHDYLSAHLEWPQAKTLPQGVLDDAASFQAPDGGMTFWTAEDDRVSPYLSAATALAFNRLAAAGYEVPGDVQKKLDAYLNRLLRDKNAPTFYSEGMVSSVRAVALESLAERHQLSLEELRRYEPATQRMDLFGLAAFLSAATRVPGAQGLSADAARKILSHSNESGGQFHFSEPWDDGYSQMLATPLRSECAVLSALLLYAQTPEGAALIADVPFKLVRSITQSRGSRDHWENTQENLYCTSALAAYAAAYEKTPPAFTVAASIDGAPLGDAKFSSLRDPPLSIVRANGADDADRRAVVSLVRSGEGRVYFATRLTYSLTDAASKASNAGIEVRREYSVQRGAGWQLVGPNINLRCGELMRVDLYLTLPAPRHFVVVDDPVPGGVEPVDRDLATASTVDADAVEFIPAGGSFWFKYADWSEYGTALWSFYHRELKHDAARFYADYLPAGHYHLSYGVQAIAAGEFIASATKAEEMYDPDVYGKALPARFSVGPE